MSQAAHVFEAHDSATLSIDECRVVSSAPEFAALLRSASPMGARDFARTMHEQACAAGNDERCAFWMAVLDRLRG